MIRLRPIGRFRAWCWRHHRGIRPPWREGVYSTRSYRYAVWQSEVFWAGLERQSRELTRLRKQYEPDNAALNAVRFLMDEKNWETKRYSVHIDHFVRLNYPEGIDGPEVKL